MVRQQAIDEEVDKVEIRMLKKNELDEYCDVHLYDPDYKKNEVCKNITDDMILDVVVGKLHAVG